MPVLVDLSQFLVMSVMIQTKLEKELDENMVRHVFLNSLRQNRAKFHSEYGELVLCVDSKDRWRQTVFPYYKAHRKKNRDASTLNWKSIFEIFDKIQNELIDVFPYKFIKVSGAEGDDVIATLCKNFPREKKLILSSDKDFVQLHKYPGVAQYDPAKKKFIKEKDPGKFLREHVIRGDEGDGIPNMLSDDDTFVSDEKRQKSVFQKKIDEWLSVSEDEFYRELTEEQKSNYNRNKMLIDFDFIPAELNDSILEEFKKEPKGHRSKILNFFIKNRMKNLIESIQDF